MLNKRYEINHCNFCKKSNDLFNSFNNNQLMFFKKFLTEL